MNVFLVYIELITKKTRLLKIEPFAVNVVDGENLTISKVSRLHMGAYLCIASNGVPPSVSKRIVLMVQCKYTYLQ